MASLTRPSLQILGKTQTGYWAKLSISNLQISDQSLINENCHTTRTSNDIDMKLGRVCKRGKKNREMSEKFDDDALTTHCDAIVIFLIYGQFGAIWKSDFGCIICNTYIFINSNFFP